MAISLAPKKKMVDNVLVKKVLTPIVKNGGSTKGKMPKKKMGGMSRKSC